MAESSLSCLSSLSFWKRQRGMEILRTILEKGPQTRDQLCQSTGLTRASIINYTQLLSRESILRAKGTEAGRLLSYHLSPSLGSMLAIVVAKSVQAIIVSLDGTILAQSAKVTFPSPLSPELFLTSVQAAVDQVRDGLGRSDMLGMGVAIGGYIDPKNGISHTFYQTEGWKDFPLGETLKHAYNLPVFIMNDVKAATLGEKYHGLARAYDDALLVWLGDGTAMGVILNGKPYDGASYSAGEIGHVKITGGDRLCYCGQVGCLETMTTEKRIMEAYHRLVMQVGGMDLPYESIVQDANNGNRFAQKAFEEAITALSDTLSTLCMAFNPQAVLMLGPVIDGNPYLFEAIKERMQHLLMAPILQPLQFIGSPKMQGNKPIAQGLAAKQLLDILEKFIQNGTDFLSCSAIS